MTCPAKAQKKALERVIFDCIQFCRDHNLEKICYFTRSINHLHPHNKYDLIVKAIRQIYPECSFKRIVCATTVNGPDEEITVPISSYLRDHTFDIALTPNQRMGLLAQKCLLQKDFRVPQTIKHICLASSPFLLNVYPQISSIHIPLFEMGYYAAELMVSLVQDAPVPEKDFECLLLHGDSTRF